MITEQDILNKIQSFLDSKNLFAIDIHISPHNQIELTLDGDNYVSIDDCTEVSRYIEGILNRDVEDFSLIVSSPDANKPLKVFRQYPKHIGKEIQIITQDNQEIKGILNAAQNEELSIIKKSKQKINNKNQLVEEEIKVPFSSIKKAKIKLPF